MIQKMLIISHLKQYGSLTPLESLRLYGCMRLASRIKELRQDGYDIGTFMVDNGKNRYAKYVLKYNPEDMGIAI